MHSKTLFCPTTSPQSAGLTREWHLARVMAERARGDTEIDIILSTIDLTTEMLEVIPASARLLGSLDEVVVENYETLSSSTLEEYYRLCELYRAVENQTSGHCWKTIQVLAVAESEARLRFLAACNLWLNCSLFTSHLLHTARVIFGDLHDSTGDQKWLYLIEQMEDNNE